MQNLTIPGTSSTPAITTDADAGLLLMSGDSYPENAFEFFTPVLDWVRAYLEQNDRALKLELALLYLNTSSIRILMDILDQLEDAHQAGGKISLSWRYAPENERVAELAEEFREDCSFPFDIIKAHA